MSLHRGMQQQCPTNPCRQHCPPCRHRRPPIRGWSRRRLPFLPCSPLSGVRTFLWRTFVRRRACPTTSWMPSWIAWTRRTSSWCARVRSTSSDLIAAVDAVGAPDLALASKPSNRARGRGTGRRACVGIVGRAGGSDEGRGWVTAVRNGLTAPRRILRSGLSSSGTRRTMRRTSWSIGLTTTEVTAQSRHGSESYLPLPPYNKIRSG